MEREFLNADAEGRGLARTGREPDVLRLQETKLSDDAFSGRHLPLARLRVGALLGQASGTASPSCRGSASSSRSVGSARESSPTLMPG
ncbi:MAG: hypothetical protein R2710_05170 [Acidimicrobiales bacterium]